MAECILIFRPDGLVSAVRSKLESPSEAPLTEHEKIINELVAKIRYYEQLKQDK